MPVLKTYNPRIDEALLRLSAIASDEMAFLEELTSGLWSDIVEEFDNALSLDTKKLAMQSGAIQRQLLRWAFKYLCGDTRDLETEHLEAMVNFISKPAGKTLHLPHGLRVHKEYNRLLINLDEKGICPFPSLEKEYKLRIPGETTLPGWSIKADILKQPVKVFESGFTASFDLDKTGNLLTVRSRKRGDSFQPLGMKQSKNLQHFMADAKIPDKWRDLIPLVCAPDKIIWVAGWRIDDSVKISNATKKIIRLSFKRTA